uniref:hypothetical protein n=1 Tax=Nitrospira cf. moscoviensis SBR1015 TaxID=96242 RepID=UPI0011213F28
MKNANVYAILLLVATFAQIVGCRESAEVKIVKQSSVNACSNKTMEQMVAGTFVSPSWVGSKTESGIRFVSINGKIQYLGKTVDGLLKFTFDETGDAFHYGAFEMNGVPQNDFLYMGLVAKMCQGNHQAAEAVKENLRHIASTSIALNAETGTWQRASINDYFGAFGRQSPVEEKSPFGARYSYWIAVNGTPTMVPGQRWLRLFGQILP